MISRITNASWLIPFAIFSLALAACSPLAGDSPANAPESAGGVSPAVYYPEDEQTSAQTASAASHEEQAPQGMVAFDGSLFVASTRVIPDQWRLAGWRIADQPIDTDAQTAPPDCTLYPHLGVSDQWVGSCNGHVLIPQTGASNIAVILTNPDGSTTMVQVAPPPNSP